MSISLGGRYDLHFKKYYVIEQSRGLGEVVPLGSLYVLVGRKSLMCHAQYLVFLEVFKHKYEMSKGTLRGEIP